MPTLPPPNNQEAERSVLGSMLQDADAAQRGLCALTAIDFYNPAHGEIFSAMQALQEARQPVDLVTVDAELERRNTLAGVGGAGYMIEISQYVPTTANIDAYIAVVIDCSLRRQTIALLRKAAQDIFQNKPLGETIASARSDLAGIVSPGETGKTLKDMLIASLTGMMRKEESLRVGIPWVDAHFALRNGELTVIGGRPGAGKSVMLLQIAMHVACHGKAALLISTEMSDQQIGDRAHASLDNVPMNNIIRKNATLEEHQRMAMNLSLYENIPLYEEEGRYTVAQVANLARRYKERSDISLLAVDYLQLLKAGVKKGTREQEVAYITGELKGLSLELKIPILIASQLSRDMTRAGRRPQLHDLRESGAIEQDCDNVLFLYVPNEEEAITAQLVDTDILIAKQRQGEANMRRTLMFNKPLMKFTEIETRIGART